jgi:hypothetical protein
VREGERERQRKNGNRNCNGFTTENTENGGELL